jgi:hypothetical protein
MKVGSKINSDSRRLDNIDNGDSTVMTYACAVCWEAIVGGA